MEQITTITFFRFSSLSDRIRGFGMMGSVPGTLQEVPGLSFYKLMGSGRGGGFNPLPDWSVYCLLQVWDSEIFADRFFSESEIIRNYRGHAREIWTVYMKNSIARGEWSGGNPFETSSTISKEIPHLAVITRATIKLNKLIPFWRYVPTSRKSLADNPGLIFTKGVGEWPITQMATFSLWSDADALRRFAYESPEHQKAIKMTRELDWYKEELFARFQPYRSEGIWGGVDLLPGLST